MSTQYFADDDLMNPTQTVKTVILGTLATFETVDADVAGSCELHKLATVAALIIANAAREAKLSATQMDGVAVRTISFAVASAYSEMNGEIDCDSPLWPEIVQNWLSCFVTSEMLTAATA